MEWREPDADLANTRRVRSAVDAENAHRLRLSWTLPLRASYSATPVIVNGIAYTADVQANVYAIDLRSGKLRWRKDFNVQIGGPNGVNVANGRVFGAVPTGAYALDASTGKLLWSTRLIHGSELIVMTPGYDNGIVYVSTNPISMTDVGTLWAIEGSTGRILWHWKESSGERWSSGSGGLWHPPAFDERGGLYISTADPGPWPGTAEKPWGRDRPGSNKWSNSIIKLDARTGRFIWGQQPLQHDFYDWDLEGPVILASVHGRRVALTAGKMGVVYAFDAETGQPLWKRSVGLHNGHDQDSVRALHGDFSSVIKYGEKMLPGDQGGVETQMASDGKTVYVPVNNLYVIYREQSLPVTQGLMRGTGEFVALDIATGRVLWDRRLPHGEYGGATVTNDLVFTTTYDGTAWALERRNGRLVWKASLPAGSISPVAITGRTVLAAGGVPVRPRQRLKVVAFRLGGRARGHG